jgi:3-phosphoshikimate 1-carboxyvinyltransferase
VTTRDHTERLLEALGAPVRIDGRTVSVSAFQHGGFEGTVPADPSSASFLLAAAAITGSALRIVGVGLNPSRLAFLDVMRRLGAEIDQTATGSEMGEPVGDLAIAEGTNLTGTAVEAIDIPLVIDEVPVLAAMASHAEGQTRFLSAGELRVKESDRLEGTAAGLTELGGTASVEGNDLIIGGGGLAGGEADARRDHRLAMAFCVAALGARGTSAVDGMEWAAVTFPGFERSLAELGANLEIA